MNEKVDEKEAVEKYGISPKDTKWVDTDKAFEEDPMQIRSRICARAFENDDRPNLYAGTPPLEVESYKIDCSEPQRNVFNHASMCYVRTSTRRPRDQCCYDYR